MVPSLVLPPPAAPPAPAARPATGRRPAGTRGPVDGAAANGADAVLRRGPQRAAVSAPAPRGRGRLWAGRWGLTGRDGPGHRTVPPGGPNERMP